MNIFESYHNVRRCFLTLGMLLAFSHLYAQQFSVQHFRQLPNDISAYIQPEKDLNDEACALIKIVGNRDFVFSTPLGIVKRKNDVGETWIYVPRGTVQITIKHPQWGVLRDYRFPSPLESRLTYELVLNSPITMPRKKIPPMENNIVEFPRIYRLPTQLPEPAKLRLKRPKEDACYLIILDASVHENEVAGGIRFGWMRRHGIYLHVLSNFRTTANTNGMECDKNGIPKGDDIPPYYTGKTKNSHYALLAGGLHRIAGNFCIYEGIGYGVRTVIWETNEGNYLRNTDYSSKGIAAELGAMLRLQRFVFSAGAITTRGNYWELNIGIGILL